MRLRFHICLNEKPLHTNIMRVKFHAFSHGGHVQFDYIIILAALPTSAEVGCEYVRATCRNMASDGPAERRLCQKSMKYREHPPVLTDKVTHAASLCASKSCYLLFLGFSCLFSRVCRSKHGSAVVITTATT